MKRTTKILLGASVGAVVGLALTIYFKKKNKTETAVASYVVGGCAVVSAVGIAVYAEQKRRKKFPDSEIGQFARKGIEELKSTN